MKKLSANPEVFEVIKALASTNKETSYNAQEALAAAIAPVLNEQYMQARTLSTLFEKLPFNKYDKPTIQLDLFRDQTNQDVINVWQQSLMGGVPTNEIVKPTAEITVDTNTMTTAMAFLKKYAAQGNLDVVQKTFQYIGQQFLGYDEQTAMNVICLALVKAVTNGNQHVLRAKQKGRFTLDDFNRLITYSKRLYTSWMGGTPVGVSKGITDLYVSPEMMEEIRKMSYNPVNTAPAPFDGSIGNGIPAPEKMREQIYASGGQMNFFGIELMEYLEFGKGQRFNEMFADVAGTEPFYGTPFNPEEEEIILGVDRNTPSLYSLVEQSGPGEFITFVPDDSFTVRSGKVGWWGSMTEGKVILDDRVLSGIIV